MEVTVLRVVGDESVANGGPDILKRSTVKEGQGSFRAHAKFNVGMTCLHVQVTVGQMGAKVGGSIVVMPVRQDADVIGGNQNPESYWEKDGNMVVDAYVGCMAVQIAVMMLGVVHMPGTCYLGCSKGNVGGAIPSIGLDKDYSILARSICIMALRIGVKHGDRTGDAGIAVHMYLDLTDVIEGGYDLRDYLDDRELHEGMAATFVGQMCITTVHKGAGWDGLDVCMDSTTDDSSPCSVHRSGHDVNGGDKMDMLQTKVLLDGIAKLTVDKILKALAYDSEDMDAFGQHCDPTSDIIKAKPLDAKPENGVRPNVFKLDLGDGVIVTPLPKTGVSVISLNAGERIDGSGYIYLTNVATLSYLRNGGSTS